MNSSVALWEIKQFRSLGIPLFLLWLLLSLPYKMRGAALKIIGKSSKKYGYSYHEYLWSITRFLNLPDHLSFKIEETLFQNPNLHEPEVSQLLIKTKGELFVDVGANLGRYTIMLSPNYKRVIAIEPEPNNMQYLKRSIQQAGLKNIRLIQKAISDRNGPINLYLARHSGGHTIKTEYYSDFIKVQATTLNSLLKNENNIDLIKVDVEGAEWQVLKGSQMIMPKIKSWMIELHDNNRKKELEEYLSHEGYSTRWLDEKHIYAWRNNR